MKLLELMLKAKLSRPNKNSKKVLKSRNNHSKKQLCLKSQQLSKLRKNYSSGLEQMQKERHKMLSSTLKKVLKMLSKVQRKQLVIRDPSFSRPSRTSLRDGRTQNRLLRIHMILQQRSWVKLGVQSKRLLDRKLSKQAKLWNRKEIRCNRTHERDLSIRMILKILYKHIRFNDDYKNSEKINSLLLITKLFFLEIPINKRTK